MTDKEIELPKTWSCLTAGGTRFAIMLELYRIAHWNDQEFANSTGQFMKRFCDTFLDDTLFCEAPTSMIGQSLFADEQELSNSFCHALKTFLRDIDVSAWIEKKEIVALRQGDIRLPDELIKHAADLYGVMVRKGDPNAEQYIK